MALEAPNFFDPADFVRMRTVSRPYNSNIDYGRIIFQLNESCREFGYLAIAPQNLVEPALLESVIVMPYYNKPVRAFVDPQIIEVSGGRIQQEGCANIRLVYNGKQFAVAIKTRRPTRLVVSHVVDGRRVTTKYGDRRPATSQRISAPALICHEVDHTQGKLITDLARQRLIKAREVLKREVKNLSVPSALLYINYNLLWAPKALVRDGDKYVLRLASEFGEEDIPPVSPDMLYLDHFFSKPSSIRSIFVPRGGELLPIKTSESFDLYFS